MALPKGTAAGAFHAGVEVLGLEWSFGSLEGEGTGVFSCVPAECDMHQYRERIDMGETPMTEDEVRALLAKMSDEWPGSGYDLLRRNCCSFSNELCVNLGVGEIPAHVNRLATTGAAIADKAKEMEAVAEKVLGVVEQKVNQLDEQYDISARMETAASAASSRAEQAAQQAKAYAQEKGYDKKAEDAKKQALEAAQAAKQKGLSFLSKGKK